MRILTGLICMVLLGSCTITKRLHNPGWHVEWKQSFKTTDQPLTESTEEKSEPKSENNLVLERQDGPQTAEVEKELNLIPGESSQNDQDRWMDEASTAAYDESSIRPKDPILEDNIEYVYNGKSKAEQRPKHPLAIAAFALMIAAIVLSLLALSVVNFTVLTGMEIVAAILLLSAIIVSFIALKKININQDKYSGRVLSRTTLLICSVITVIGISIGLLALIFSLSFSSNGSSWL